MDYGFVVVVPRAPAPGPAHVRVCTTDEGTCVEAEAFQAFARAVPTTPEAGREGQPIVNRGTVLFYEGRVDNRDDVALALGRPELAEAADGQVIVEAYEAWGPTFSGRLVGEFGLVLWDRRKRTLIAARDSIGVRKLYYRADEQGVIVASNLSLLLSTLPATPSFDFDGIAEFLHIGDLGDERTVFSGIRLVPIGHALVVDSRHGLKHLLTWEPDFDSELNYKDPADYEEQLRHLLDEAVSRALRSNGNACVELSGGLDSSTVTAVAARLAHAGRVSSRLCAYSVTASETPQSDESLYQEAVVEAVGIERHAIDSDAYPPFGPHPDPPPCEPRMNLSNTIVCHGVRKFAAERQIRACLTGEGGDSVFVGDRSVPWFLCDRIRAREWRQWMRDVAQYLASGSHNAYALLKVSSGIRWRPEPFGGATWMQPIFRRTVDASFRNNLMSRMPVVSRPARALQHLLIQRGASHASAKLSWDERHPLLYRPLVQFMLSVPWELKLAPGEERRLQRRALRGILPEMVRCRTTKGRPAASILKGLSRNWRAVEPLAKGPRLAALGIVDPRLFWLHCQQLRHGHISRRTGFACSWGALVLERWLQMDALGEIDAARRRHKGHADAIKLQGSPDGAWHEYA